jgi:protein involved in polysaccharide export with SLBB domain
MRTLSAAAMRSFFRLIKTLPAFDIGTIRRGFIALALLVLVQFPVAGIAADAPAYRLGPGDKVRVTIFNEKDLSGDFEVNDQGEIALPLIGQVKVRGKTISEAEALFTQKYNADYLVNPRINVEVLNYRPFFILGEVKNPASYPYQNGMTIINAVALAGGYTPRANKGRILVKRADHAEAGEQPVAEDAPVLPGDIIRVTERFF